MIRKLDFETAQIGGGDVVVVYRREAMKKAKAKYPNPILYSHLEVDALKDCPAKKLIFYILLRRLLAEQFMTKKPQSDIT